MTTTITPDRRPPIPMNMNTFFSIFFTLLLGLMLCAAAFLSGCIFMAQYRGPIRWKRFHGGPFRGQYNLGAVRPYDLYLRLTSAIANPGNRVGPRPGPTRPQDHPAYDNMLESLASWSARSVLYELGVGVRLQERTQTVTARVPVAVPLAEIDGFTRDADQADADWLAQKEADEAG